MFFSNCRKWAIAVALLAPSLLSAHLIVDVSVAIQVPAFVVKSAPITYTIDVTNLAYDQAYGVVVEDRIPLGSQLLSAQGTGWNCTTSNEVVRCAAEQLAPGVSTITLAATAPSMVGPTVNTVSVTTVGSIDPYAANNTASSQTIIYDPTSCSDAAPAILTPADQTVLGDGKATLAWTAVPGATRYRAWSGVEGALPSQIGETAATQLSLEVERGSTEWWVEAVFDSCPGTISQHAHFVSLGRPLRLNVSDYAGRAGISGRDDGALAAATFASPVSLGIDVYGNMYVADMESSTIRRITNGTVSTPAGVAGVAGSSDGTPKYSTLNHPGALAVSSGGYVYIADTDNHLIRFFFPDGNGVIFAPFLATLAGASGMQGTADGVGASARFFSPAGIAVSPSSTIFVADTKNGRLRQMRQNIQGSTVTSLTAAQFNGPTGIALDPQGNIYVADTDNNVIRRIGSDGQVMDVAGSAGQPGFADGVGAAARFNHPTSLAFDGLGNLFVADTGNNAIRRIAPSQFVTTVIGAGLLKSPMGIAFDASGRLFIADTGNRVIRVATAASALARRRSVHH